MMAPYLCLPWHVFDGYCYDGCECNFLFLIFSVKTVFFVNPSVRSFDVSNFQQFSLLTISLELLLLCSGHSEVPLSPSNERQTDPPKCWINGELRAEIVWRLPSSNQHSNRRLILVITINAVSILLAPSSRSLITIITSNGREEGEE